MDHLVESGPLSISGTFPVDMLCSCNRRQALLVKSAVLLGQCFAPPSLRYRAHVGAVYRYLYPASMRISFNGDERG
jgi:hypothetical protein